jgi:SAM-dependent methyltransferase
MTSMSEQDWDDRYRGTDLVWSAIPNRWVAEQTAALAPGRALDLGCGEGRNSIFLAQRGWDVTGVDFSGEAIAKARRLTLAQQAPLAIDWRRADATEFDEPTSYDLAMLVYLQLPVPQRREAIRAAWQALRPGGVLLVIAHHSDNLTTGAGGPQDPAVLYTQDDVLTDLSAIGAMYTTQRAERVERPIEGEDRAALDTLVSVVKS